MSFNFNMLVLIALIAMTVGCGGSDEIWEAIDREDVDAISAYVEGGGDVDVGCLWKNKTPLIHAIRNQKKESVKKLLELGADPNVLCKGIHSPMYEAAMQTDPYYLQVLLQNDGDPDLSNPGHGEMNFATPIELAVRNGHTDNIKLLAEQGANLNVDNPRFGSLLAIGMRTNEYEAVYCLLELGSEYDKPSPKQSGFLFFVKTQLESKAPRKQSQKDWIKKIHRWLIERKCDPLKIDDFDLN